MNDRPYSDRLARLMSYLNADPTNEDLRLEVISAALDAGALDDAQGVIEARPGDGPNAEFSNLAGLVSLRANALDAAGRHFKAALEVAPDEPSILYNAAWVHALLGEAEAALDMLTPACCQTLAQAAALQVQMLHTLGRLDDARDQAQLALETHGADQELAAIISTLAMDLEDYDLARRMAAAGAGHPDALTTDGLLALRDGYAAQAVERFEAALDINARTTRAVLGRGAARLLEGNTSAAARDLDQAAQSFGNHLGSWVAAGWAHLIAGDAESAQARFETALSLDHTFAETHGSLAVIDVLADRLDSAERRIEVARRLDRTSGSAAFGAALLATARDKPQMAKEIIDRAMRTPLDETGTTLADEIARMTSVNTRH